MQLAYSTLACPDWKWEKAVEQARALGYQGIEWRMIDGSLISADLPVETCHTIRAGVKAAGLKTCALDASVQLAVAPGDAREKVVTETTGMLRVAHELGAPMLRVFIGQYPPETPDDTAVTLVTDCLARVLPTAKKLGVIVALEVHSFDGRGKNINGTSDSSLCRRVVEACTSPSLGILWDVGNPYNEGEKLAETWENVKGHVSYLHVKDEKKLPGGDWKYVLCGEGEVELREMFALLKKDGFKGWASFEWEKKWHPDLAEPDIALPHYVKAMRTLGAI
jgi:sugar phosphate isomerase/epimerase